MSSLIIIGAGPGGYKTALHAAKHGIKVTIFEAEHVGGTCLNVGCIPTKTYVHSASFAEAVERQPQVVEQLRSGIETLLSHPNITLVRERASFVDAHTVETPSGQRFTADNIIIATGSSTKLLPFVKPEDLFSPNNESPSQEGLKANFPLVVDSTGLLALKELPKRLCIIGAGVIGMEFASVFNRFGSEVTVIEFLKECLPMLDSDIAKRLRKLMEKRGVVFNLQCGVKQIADGKVFFENKKGQMESVEADVILIATGRKANTEGLKLEALGITLERNGAIPVNDNYEVKAHPLPLPKGGESQEGVSIASRGNESPSLGEGLGVGLHSLYAIGDVNGRQMLAHAAEYQGLHVVNHILGIEDHIRFDIMPGAIFTEPEAANVGPSEDQLKEAGIDFECHKAFYRANGKALAMGETEGMLKLCCEPDEGRLLSCHAFGPHAADLVQEATTAMNLGATLQQLRETVHIHPTLSEVLIEVN